MPWPNQMRGSIFLDLICSRTLADYILRDRLDCNHGTLINRIDFKSYIKLTPFDPLWLVSVRPRDLTCSGVGLARHANPRLGRCTGHLDTIETFINRLSLAKQLFEDDSKSV